MQYPRVPTGKKDTLYLNVDLMHYQKVVMAQKASSRRYRYLILSVASKYPSIGKPSLHTCTWSAG